MFIGFGKIELVYRWSYQNCCSFTIHSKRTEIVFSFLNWYLSQLFLLDFPLFPRISSTCHIEVRTLIFISRNISRTCSWKGYSHFSYGRMDRDDFIFLKQATKYTSSVKAFIVFIFQYLACLLWVFFFSRYSLSPSLFLNLSLFWMKLFVTVRINWCNFSSLLNELPFILFVPVYGRRKYRYIFIPLLGFLWKWRRSPAVQPE